MKATYKDWLEQLEPKLTSGTIQAQFSRAEKVEQCYGDLDKHYNRDRLRVVIDGMKYSAADEREHRPNPSKIDIKEGSERTMLAAYRHSTERYCKFRRETDEDDGIDHGDQAVNRGPSDEAQGQLFGLERDLQRALRLSIDQLEDGLEVADAGAERSVASGFIDITAKDKSGSLVVIELKAGTARQSAVGQILSYMGDLAEEEGADQVRGILVAGDFDKKARAAARVVPSLSLRSYSVRFEFRSVGGASK